MSTQGLGSRRSELHSVCLQLLLIGVGAACNVLLIMVGLVRADVYSVVTTPFIGLMFQLQSLLFISIQPLALLSFGIMGFLALIVIPGLVLSHLIYEDLDIFTRLLIGTAIPILTDLLLISYGLIFGLPPGPVILFLPLTIACCVSITRPTVLEQTVADCRDYYHWVSRSFSRHKYLWSLVIFMVLHRIALFCITDSYWTDSIAYVTYATAIANGTLFMGMDFVHPVGYPLVAFPFTWLVGSITWGLALASFALTPIGILGTVPIIQRLYSNWPSRSRPPLALVLFAFVTFPWLTLEMTTIFTEPTLYFFTVLAANTVFSIKRHPEVWLGVSTGVAFLIRPTHAVLFFVFIIYPLLSARRDLKSLVRTGIRSLTVGLPVVPWLIRNLMVEHTLIASTDLAYFGAHNIPLVLLYLGAFVAQPADAVFSLLFIVPLVLAAVRFVPRLRYIDIELRLWLLFSVVSFGVFLLWPTDQPRFYAFFLWLLPVFFVFEMWDLNWRPVVYMFLAWQFMIFGAFPFSPLGWLIRSASSMFTGDGGIVRPYPEAGVVWIYAINLLLSALWLILAVYARRQYHFRVRGENAVVG